MKKTVFIAAALLTASIMTSGKTSPDDSFGHYFSDSTLRVDYILGGDTARTDILFAGARRSPDWAGRRSDLSSLPLAGNGTVTVTDAATGDTIYRQSFSTLFQEWLATDEARHLSRSYEHVALMPLPLRDAEVSLQLFNSRRQPVASHRWHYSPTDLLVAREARAALPYRVIHEATDTAGGRPVIEIAILAEGYRQQDMDSFYMHAQRAADEILSYEPFRRYAGRFRFTAVASASADSGVSIPRLGRWADTAFGSHFSTFYSDRYLTTPHLFKVHDALAGLPYSHIIILANTDEYGGGGIYNNYLLTTARHPSFRPVVVHEFGHSFGGLADEYFYEEDVMEDSYPTDTEPWEPNITTLCDFGSKWQKMLKKGTPVPTPPADRDKYPVGLYEGGGYSTHGVYRPADECRMRNNTYPVFCPVCSASLERVIRFYTR